MSVRSSRNLSWRKGLKLKGEYHTVVRWVDSFLKLGSWICGVLVRGKNSTSSFSALHVQGFKALLDTALKCTIHLSNSLIATGIPNREVGTLVRLQLSPP